MSFVSYTEKAIKKIIKNFVKKEYNVPHVVTTVLNVIYIHILFIIKPFAITDHECLHKNKLIYDDVMYFEPLLKKDIYIMNPWRLKNKFNVNVLYRNKSKKANIHNIFKKENFHSFMIQVKCFKIFFKEEIILYQDNLYKNEIKLNTDFSGIRKVLTNNNHLVILLNNHSICYSSTGKEWKRFHVKHGIKDIKFQNYQSHYFYILSLKRLLRLYYFKRNQIEQHKHHFPLVSAFQCSNNNVYGDVYVQYHPTFMKCLNAFNDQLKKLNDSFSDLEITYYSIGWDHGIIHDENRVFYAFGNNSSGQCMVNSKLQNLNKVTKMKFPIPISKIYRVQAFYNETLIFFDTQQEHQKSITRTPNPNTKNQEMNKVQTKIKIEKSKKRKKCKQKKNEQE